MAGGYPRDVMIAIPGWEELQRLLLAQFRLGAGSEHGPAHWQRVAGFGLGLAAETGADPTVVRLFGLFHDAGRVAEDHDPGHGTRGAALAARFHREGRLDLDQARLHLLLEACDAHTDTVRHSDPTIATCFDADRLDLARYGVAVDPRFLNTEAAREVARGGTVGALPPRLFPHHDHLVRGLDS